LIYFSSLLFLIPEGSHQTLANQVPTPDYYTTRKLCTTVVVVEAISLKQELVIQLPFIRDDTDEQPLLLLANQPPI